MADPARERAAAFPEAPPSAWPAAIVPAAPDEQPPDAGPAGWGPGAWLILALAVVFSVIVTYGLGTALSNDHNRLIRDRDVNAQPETTPSVAPPAESSLTDLMPDLIAFVERTRGHKFAAPPTLVELSDPTFDSTVQGWLGREATELTEVALRYEALGAASTGFAPALQPLVTVAPVAYDTRTNRIAARSSIAEQPSPLAKVELVRTLTLVLDSQLHEDVAPVTVASIVPEQDFGLAAVAAGSADFVANLYLATLSGREHDLYSSEVKAAAEQLATAPSPTLRTAQAAPRTYGAGEVAAFVRAIGMARLDELFEQPPFSSAQVIRGELAKPTAERPLRVSDPKPDGTALARGSFGALDMLLTIQSENDSVNLQIPAAWAGGRFVLWYRPDGAPCVRYRVVGETAEETQVLLGIAAEWRTTSGAIVALVEDKRVSTSDQRVVEVTRCGRG